MGAELVPVPMPDSTGALLGERVRPYEKTVWVEAASYHRRLVRERAALYSPEVLGTIQSGEGVPGPDYVDGQRLRATWSREWRATIVTLRLDTVASPVIPEPPGPQTPSRSVAALDEDVRFFTRKPPL